MTQPPEDHTQILNSLSVYTQTHGTCARRNVVARLSTWGFDARDGHRFPSVFIDMNRPPHPSVDLCINGGCPRGQKTEEEVPAYSPYGDCTYIHAEAAVLLGAGFERTEGATLYVTEHPCWDCAKLIVAASIKELVVFPDTPEKILDFLNRGGVAVRECQRAS